MHAARLLVGQQPENRKIGLTPQQKKYLRGLAHHIKPVVMVAGKGLTDNVLHEIDLALLHHELIKVRLRVSPAEQTQFSERILTASNAERIHTVGQILVLYRRNADDPKLSLPG